MKCTHCGKEIENEDLEWFGCDGDAIHKGCRDGINKAMDSLANMSDSEFYTWMTT